MFDSVVVCWGEWHVSEARTNNLIPLLYLSLSSMISALAANLTQPSTDRPHQTWNMISSQPFCHSFHSHPHKFNKVINRWLSSGTATARQHNYSLNTNSDFENIS
jgi:hypothetical protein